MKRFFTFSLMFVLLLSGCVYPKRLPQTTEASQTVQLANPWRSFATLGEAETAAGITFSVPEKVETFHAESFRVMNGQLLEAVYQDGDYEVIVRKQLGEGQDISGVFETFATETVYQTGNSWIITRVSEKKMLDMIDSGGFSWSVYAPNGYPGDAHGDFLDVILGQSQTWLREANAAFNATTRENGGATRASEISCFFSCTWSSPEEIDLAAFLRYCPLREQLLDENSEEAQAVIAAAEENVFAVTPVWRYPKEAVSSLLRKYTGITVEDLLSREGVLYLEEYDAFYNFTSDWGPGRFLCTGGERTGNQIVLWGEGNGGTAGILTIREEKDTYFFESYLDSED